MSPTASKRRSSRWIAFFILLAILAGTGVVLPIIYNLGQQLRPEHLDAARARWKAVGPSDYDLTFSIQYDREPSAERHVVLVRQRRVVYASCEGEIVHLSPALGAVLGVSAGSSQGEGFDVPAIFNRVDAMLCEEDSKRNFLIAVFDPKEGWPRRFIRRVRGTSTREEWNLRVWPAGELAQQAKKR